MSEPTTSLSSPENIAMEALLHISPEKVGALDIARMNLTCAVGLPGAENLDVEQSLQTLQHWAQRIAQATKRLFIHFQRHPSQYENSEPYWRMLVLTTVLQKEFGVSYNPRLMKSQGWDWQDSRDVFIHGLLDPPHTGSCASLPVLMVALGRCLGYPLHMVHAPAHLFSRWDGLDSPNPAWQSQINLECHGLGLHTEPDDHYRHWPVEWTPALLEAERARPLPLYLRSLTPAEELAHGLVQRSHVLQAHHRYDEAYAACAKACELAPHQEVYAGYAREIRQEKLSHVLQPWTLSIPGFHHACCTLNVPSLGGPAPFPWEPSGPAPRILPETTLKHSTWRI